MQQTLVVNRATISIATACPGPIRVQLMGVHFTKPVQVLYIEPQLPLTANFYKHTQVTKSHNAFMYTNFEFHPQISRHMYVQNMYMYNRHASLDGRH